MKSTIEEIQVFLKHIGEGKSGPVAYDTAWIARIPDSSNPKVPAFRNSLNWVRNHQNPDGTWGNITPFSAHNLTLNTLSAMIALAQWKQCSQDLLRIDKGLNALQRLAPLLEKEKLDFIAFELILPSLVVTAKKLGIKKLPEDIYDLLNGFTPERKNSIIKRMKTMSIGTWAHSLEIFENTDLLACVFENSKVELMKFAEHITSKRGIVFCSPAASAYVLKTLREQGLDFPIIADYLSELSANLEGGVPIVDPIDYFQIIFGLEHLLKAGVSPEEPFIKSKIDQLLEIYHSSPNGIGFSSDVELTDGDDTAVMLRVLHMAGHKVSIKSLLRFWNGNYFYTFIGETTSSLSANINILHTLRLFEKEIHGLSEIIQKLVDWIRKKWVSTLNGFTVFLPDKWNISPNYVTSRIIYGLKDIEIDLYNRCIEYFLQSQNMDGGWGINGVSTAEETGSVILALLDADDTGKNIQRALGDGYNYIQRVKNNTSAASLWIDKVLYSVPALNTVAILGAEYAIQKRMDELKPVTTTIA